VDPQYNYSFSVWPREDGGWKSAMFTLFRMFNGRIELQMGEFSFKKFREDLESQGVTLREIERVPYVVPERVT